MRKDHCRVEAMHEKMWPGIKIELMPSKHSNTGEKADTWFPHRTIPTSQAFAWLAHMLTFKYMPGESRQLAFEGFNGWLNSLLQATGRFQLQHVQCGRHGQNPEHIPLEIDTSGRVKISQFFTEVCWDEMARKLWYEDLKNDKKPWVSTRVSFSNHSTVPFSEVITFSLDPQHHQRFREVTESYVLDLLTHLADLFDSSVLAMSSLTPGGFFS